MAQLTLNNRQIIMIDESTFYINYEQHLNLFITLKNLLQVITVLKDVSQLKKLYKETSKNIKYN